MRGSPFLSPEEGLSLRATLWPSREDALYLSGLCPDAEMCSSLVQRSSQSSRPRLCAIWVVESGSHRPKVAVHRYKKRGQVLVSPTFGIRVFHHALNIIVEGGQNRVTAFVYKRLFTKLNLRGARCLTHTWAHDRVSIRGAEKQELSAPKLAWQQRLGLLSPPDGVSPQPVVFSLQLFDAA